MKLKNLALTAFFTAFLFTSCSKDDDPIVETPLGGYVDGTLILNQGGFGNGNASVSFLSNDIATFQNNIFSLINPTLTLGDTAQDIGFYNELAYIVLNGSNKIEIVNRYTLKHIASITTGLSNPRYIVFANGKGYVSNWGSGTSTTDDFIAVINLSNNTLMSSIPIAEGPERMVVNNNKLYVAQYGGFGSGSTVSVVNLSNNAVTTINVGDLPNTLEIYNGILYVLCEGKQAWTGTETIGKLSKINLSNDTVSGSLDFALTVHPSNLDIENGELYYTVNSAVYKTTTSATAAPTTSLFSTSAQGVSGIYSFAVRNDKIYVGDATDYSSNGKVHVYSTSGTLLTSKTVGVIPAGFYFN